MKHLTNFSYGQDKLNNINKQFPQDAQLKPDVITKSIRTTEEVIVLLCEANTICDLMKGGQGSGPHKQLGDQAYREATKVGVKLSQKNSLIKQAEKHYNDHAESLDHKQLMTAHDNSTHGSLHQKVLATHIHQRANEVLTKQHETNRMEGKVPHTNDISHAKQILSRNIHEPREPKTNKSIDDDINNALDDILCKAHTGKLDTSHLVLKDVFVTGKGTQKRWVDPNKGNKEFAPHGSEVTFKQGGKDMKGVVGDTRYLAKPNTHLYDVHGEDGRTYQKFAHHITEVHGKADKGAYGLTRGTTKPVIGESKDKEDEPKGSFYHDINKRFQVYEDLADEVINGHSIRSLLVYGSGGVGKSYTVSKLLKDSKKKAYKGPDTTPKGSDTYDHVVLKGGSLTTAGLYKALWEHNGKLIILDDNDSVLKDDNAINMLKGALDTKDRRVSKGSARPIKDDDGELIPDTFPFRGKFIFITNLDVNEPSLQPLKTRSSKIDMTMSPDQTIDRIEEIGKDKKSGKLTGFDFADDEGETGDFKYSHDDAKYVMDFMRDHKYDFGDDLSIRTVKTLLTLKKRAERRGVDPSDYMETHILSKANDDNLNDTFNRLIV